MQKGRRSLNAPEDSLMLKGRKSRPFCVAIFISTGGPADPMAPTAPTGPIPLATD